MSEYPADVKATIGELKSAFIDVTIHAQQAFKLAALIEQQAKEIEDARRTAEYWKAEHNAANARIAELSTCKLCNSTGNDTPCAYPTEINRQQAARIAALESAEKEAVPVAEVVGSNAICWVRVDSNNLKPGDKLYTHPAPASKDAIRREALEEAAKVCDRNSERLLGGVTTAACSALQVTAAAIRALSQKVGDHK
jgi:hypothetical protein